MRAQAEVPSAQWTDTPKRVFPSRIPYQAGGAQCGAMTVITASYQGGNDIYGSRSSVMAETPIRFVGKDANPCVPEISQRFKRQNSGGCDEPDATR
jgi:hypothetical protein